MNEQSPMFSLPALRGGIAAVAAVVLVALTLGAGCSAPPQGFEQSRCDEEGATSSNGQRRCVNGFWVRPDLDIGVDADTSDTGPDVDAGPLPPGEPCVMDRECISEVCDEGACAEPSCSDATLNGEETDLDCGGPDCDACEPDRDCKVSGDCTTGVCTDGTCRQASCDDDTLNGDETDVDCGDPDCGPCKAGKACLNAGDCQSGVCGEDDTCQAPACDDEVQNGEETAVDCGGPDCSGCDLQETCQSVDDCKSGDNIVCVDGGDGGKTCQKVTCMDETQNGNETDVDCGGDECAPCVTDDSCRDDEDCESKVCTNNICQVATCSDGVQNRDETDVDCGGSFCNTGCMADQNCARDGDCRSGVCGMDGTCNAPTCSDGTLNGDETDVDCGGPDPKCDGCATNESCMSDTDCQSRVCTSNTCAAPTCSDNKRNGNETGQDCGGPDCPKCGRQVRCLQDSDCLSGLCTNMTCAVPSCMDGVQNGQETDVDCGGPNCSKKCVQGEGCSSGGDCQTGVCGSNNTCQAPTCMDGVQNGQETDIDCGGPDCGTCGTGESCGGNDDCDSGVCNSSGVCEAPTCMDGVQNGQETDVDCGGATCNQCSIGDSCSMDGDCSTGWCDGGTCKVRIVGDLTSNNPGSWSDGTVAASCEDYRRPTKNNYVYAFAGSASGDGLYDVQPAGMNKPKTVYCDMTTDGGGWTMVIVSADDGNDNWTWDTRTRFTNDTTTFGDVTKRSEDYKTSVYHNLTFADVLVEHSGGDWAAYNGVGDGSETLATHIEQISSGSECYGNMSPNQVRPGNAMSAGTLQTSGTALCSTDLYFNAGDQDGNPNCNDNDGTYGPSWSVNDNNGCPMDDPGRSGSFGPEESNPQQEKQAQGFGQAISAAGSGSAIRLFIR